jgi:transcriptional regulator with XRE-family HTH domain
MRKLGGIKANRLAAAAGISTSYLCEIEQGKKNPSFDVVKRLATALGTDVTSLFWVKPQKTDKVRHAS